MAIVGAALFLQLTSVAVVSAQPTERAVVRVVVAGAPDQQDAMSDLLAEFFPEREFELALSKSDGINPIDVVEPPPGAPAAAARIWLELGHPKRAVVYVTDRAWERVLIRRLDFERLDAVTREEVAYVVDSSVRAILAGGQIGIAREEAAKQLGVEAAEESEETGPQATPTRPGASWSFAAGYRVRGWQTQAVQHGPTLTVASFAERPRVWIGAALVGRGYLPHSAERGNLRVELAGGHLGGLVELLIPVHPTTAIALEPGVGLDLIRDRTTALEEPAEAFPSNLRALPSLSFDAGADFFVGKGRDQLRIGLRATIDVDLLGIRYVTADSKEVLFDPWRLRPGGALTLGWRRRVN